MADDGDHAVTNPVPASVWRRWAGRAKLDWGQVQLALVAIVWSALGLTVVLWLWGLRPIVFPAADESVIRNAAMLVRKTGSPLLRLPFYDPEDLAHPRNWVTLGDYAIPAYSPFSYYVFGFLTRLRNLGFFLIAAMPGCSAAAFAVGVARQLPAPRRWLSVVAPLLGFPALYWLVRPWMNISPFLCALCWSYFFWAGWRKSGALKDLIGTFVLLGVAGAIRPDFAFYVFSIPFLLSLAADPKQWRRLVIANLGAGCAALGANLILNALITGHPFQVAYIRVIARTHGEADAQYSQKLISLLFPFGLELDAASVWSYFQKYWLGMGPIAGLLALQLTLLPWLRQGPWLNRGLRIAAIVLLLCFLFSRMGDLFGASAAVGAVHHSIARYQAPLYLFAALPPILFIGGLKRRLLFYPAAALLVALGLVSGWEIFLNQPASLTRLEAMNRKGERFVANLDRLVPHNAIVYSERLDHWTWSRVTTANIAGQDATLTSIQRAVDAGLPTYIVEEWRTSKVRRLKRALERSHLRMVRVNGNRHLYRITP